MSYLPTFSAISTQCDPYKQDATDKKRHMDPDATKVRIQAVEGAMKPYVISVICWWEVKKDDARS